MDLDELETLALAWGAHVERWPAGCRDEAIDLIARQPPQAQAILADAARLDETLGLAPAPAASAALRARILAAAPRPRRTFARFGLRGWLGAGAGAALAASCVAGALVGLLAASQGFTPSGLQTASDPALEAARLLRGPSDMAEG